MENKDLLQQKIEEAKANLSEETKGAINAIDWKETILSLREKRGYSYTQLEDLEIETELLLYGLTKPEDYPKELEKRLKISQSEASELTNELNDLIFQKIRGELIKRTEATKLEIKRIGEDNKTQTDILKSTKIEITPEKPRMEMKTPNGNGVENNIIQPSREDMLSKIENLELINIGKKEDTNKTIAPSISSQKLSGSFQIPKTQTEYSLKNNTSTPAAPISKPISPAENQKTNPKRVDPYREIPE